MGKGGGGGGGGGVGANLPHLPTPSPPSLQHKGREVVVTKARGRGSKGSMEGCKGGRATSLPVKEEGAGIA